MPSLSSLYLPLPIQTFILLLTVGGAMPPALFLLPILSGAATTGTTTSFVVTPPFLRPLHEGGVKSMMRRRRPKIIQHNHWSMTKNNNDNDNTDNIPGQQHQRQRKRRVIGLKIPLIVDTMVHDIIDDNDQNNFSPSTSTSSYSPSIVASASSVTAAMEENLNDGQQQKTPKTVFIPLPSSHLPVELSTLHIYRAEFNDDYSSSSSSSSSINNRLVMEHAFAGTDDNGASYFGHVILHGKDGNETESSNKNDNNRHNLIGAIGCASRILLAGSSSSPITILAKTSFRFVVRDIIQTEPFVMGIVDQQMDDDDNNDDKENEIINIEYDDFDDFAIFGDGTIFSNDDGDIHSNSINDDINDSDDDDDIDDANNNYYSKLNPSQLVTQTLEAMNTIIDRRLRACNNYFKPGGEGEVALSILEQSILDTDALENIKFEATIERERIEECAAVLDVLRLSVLNDNDNGSNSKENNIHDNSGHDDGDDALTIHDRLRMLASIAAEIMDITATPVGIVEERINLEENGTTKQPTTAANTNLRTSMLSLTNATTRLQIVLRALHENINLAVAQELTGNIERKNDDTSRNLKVGSPTLPQWALDIKDGTELEYYWNEEYGWCGGVVVGDPEVMSDGDDDYDNDDDGEIVALNVTVRFNDGETHQLPLRAEEKARWRPMS